MPGYMQLSESWGVGHPRSKFLGVRTPTTPTVSERMYRRWAWTLVAERVAHQGSVHLAGRRLAARAGRVHLVDRAVRAVDLVEDKDWASRRAATQLRQRLPGQVMTAARLRGARQVLSVGWLDVVSLHVLSRHWVGLYACCSRAEREYVRPRVFGKFPEITRFKNASEF